MATPRPLPTWDADPVAYPTGRKIGLALILVGPLVLFGVGMTLLGTGWNLGAFALGLGWIAFLIANQWRATRKAALSGRTLTPLQDAGFRNIVEGLASKYGIRNPELSLIEEGGPNALVLKRPVPRVAVSRSLLDSYSRTEKEAVAAHCLLRLASAPLGIAQLAAALGRSGSRFAPKVGYEDDVHAAALTRYPPALASAIEKAKPAEGPSSPLWFVAHDVSHRHPTERIAALQDL